MQKQSATDTHKPQLFKQKDVVEVVGLVKNPQFNGSIAESQKFNEGDLVMLVGLISTPEYDTCVGVCVSYDVDESFWIVEVQNKETLRVPESNLRLFRRGGGEGTGVVSTGSDQEVKPLSEEDQALIDLIKMLCCEGGIAVSNKVLEALVRTSAVDVFKEDLPEETELCSLCKPQGQPHCMACLTKGFSRKIVNVKGTNICTFGSCEA